MLKKGEMNKIYLYIRRFAKLYCLPRMLKVSRLVQILSTLMRMVYNNRFLGTHHFLMARHKSGKEILVVLK